MDSTIDPKAILPALVAQYINKGGNRCVTKLQCRYLCATVRLPQVGSGIRSWGDRIALLACHAASEYVRLARILNWELADVADVGFAEEADIDLNVSSHGRIIPA